MLDKVQIEKLMHLDKFGKFSFRNYVIVPYQHHQNKLLWKVLVTDWDTEEVGEFETSTLSIVAFSPKEAAINAIGSFIEALKTREECRQIEREMRKQQNEEKRRMEVINPSQEETVV